MFLHLDHYQQLSHYLFLVLYPDLVEVDGPIAGAPEVMLANPITFDDAGDHSVATQAVLELRLE